jgi:hypothetical protein
MPLGGEPSSLGCEIVLLRNTRPPFRRGPASRSIRPVEHCENWNQIFHFFMNYGIT